MKVLSLLVICGVVACGAFKPPRQHVPPHHPNSPHRFYAEHGPHKIIASPKPRSFSLHAPAPPNYRTVNPVYVPYRTPRSEHIHHQPTPQMIASSSNTPILVLKKDHTRPVLSSAVQATKRSEGPIPTITMENPQHREREQQQHLDEEDEHDQHDRRQQHEPAEHRAAPPNATTTSRPSSPPPQPPSQSPSQQQQPQQPSRHEMIDHEEEANLLSDEHPSAPSGPSASAERRMFFESVASNSGLAHQVSGPRPNPSAPAASKHATASSNIQQQHRAPPSPHHHPHHHHNHPHHPHRHSNNRRDDDEDGDEERERIVRSNNPYQQGQQFQYPPSQGNFIAQGPTRVPVKYQQGVIGLKQQQQQFGGHPQQQSARKPQRPYKQRIQQAQQPGSEEPISEELEDEEEAQPDRLTELLGNSKFTCGGKKDGYYADDSLNCEVFHYCQDGGKHSWMCPNGFAFHQIHLICVPPSSDNICKQSSNYHFVNEYLYKPINEKEAQTYNESLKYADRYFPDGYNHGAGDVLLPYNNNQQQSQSEEDDDRRPPIHSQLRPQHQQSPSPHTPYIAAPPSHGPPRAGPAVYNPYASHSPRPQHHQGSLTGGFVPSQQINPRIPIITSPRGGGSPYGLQHQSQSQIHPQTIVPQKPISKSASSKQQASSSSTTSSTNPAVFFTPESINIPLNQRRPIPNPHPSHHPQIFRPSPQLAHAQQQQQQQQQSSKKHHHHHSSKRRKFEDYEY